jgi:hypothetical protein
MVKSPIGIGVGGVSLPTRDQPSFDRLVRNGGTAPSAPAQRSPASAPPPATARGATTPVRGNAPARASSAPASAPNSFVPPGLQSLVSGPVTLEVDVGAPGSMPGQPFQTFGEASNAARNQNGY